MNSKKTCKHTRLKIRKHRTSSYSCLHCLDCKATWSDPTRAISYLKRFKYIEGYK